MLRAVIFDMDGVLIDSEPIWRDVEVRTFTALGLHYTTADSVLTMGMRLPEVVAHWYDRQPWSGPSVGEVSELIVSRMVEHVEAHGEPMTGAREAIATARSMGLVTAIASSSSLRLINATVSRLGLSSGIDVICSAEHEAHGKPDPAVYLTTARRLGVAPQECLAVEDSPNGVLSALAAGMLCCAVPDPTVRNNQAFRRAQMCLETLTGLTPETLLTLAAPRGGVMPSRPTA